MVIYNPHNKSSPKICGCKVERVHKPTSNAGRLAPSHKKRLTRLTPWPTQNTHTYYPQT